MCNLQVIYLVRNVWRGLSAKGAGHVLPGADKGLQRSLKDLTLTRSAARKCSNESPVCAETSRSHPSGGSLPTLLRKLLCCQLIHMYLILRSDV